MHIWNTKGMQLVGADQEIISAECSYGGAGTCQSATVRPVNTTTSGRNTLWVLDLVGAGAFNRVFFGVPDAISDADGQLAQVSLMPLHRCALGGLGGSLAGVFAAPTETLADALQRVLGKYPDADIGLRPDGTEVAWVPSGGEDVTGMAYDVRYIGPTYPDAVTDALFDPGEGWKKYVYKRTTPMYAVRRTGQAKADPAIAEAEANVVLSAPGQSDDYLPAVGQSAVYDTFIGTPPKGYERQGNILPRRYGNWFWTWTYPTDTDEQRIREAEITLSVYIGGVAEQRKEFTFVPETPGGISAQGEPSTGTDTTNTPQPIKEVQTSRDDGTTIEMALYVEKDGVWQGLGAPQVMIPRTAGSIGMFTVKFSVPEQFAGSLLQAMVSISQTNGHRIEMTVQPARIRAKRLFPNLANVVMPDGWDKPFRTSPRYEFRLPGWHIPPFRAFGQQVASATVTWNADECSTLCTTEALSYG